MFTFSWLCFLYQEVCCESLLFFGFVFSANKCAMNVYISLAVFFLPRSVQLMFTLLWLCFLSAKMYAVNVYISMVCFLSAQNKCVVNVYISMALFTLCQEEACCEYLHFFGFVYSLPERNVLWMFTFLWLCLLSAKKKCAVNVYISVALFTR